jgi:hypothetical protein
MPRQARAEFDVMFVSFATGGLSNDVFVRWFDGEVDLYPNTTNNQIGPELRLVSP